MSVSIKTEHEIELMREAGHLLEKVHDGLIPYIKPGVSTKEIDRIGEQMIRDLGCIPEFPELRRVSGVILYQSE